MSFSERATQPLLGEQARPGVVVGLRAIRTGAEHLLDMTYRRWLIGTSAACDVVLDDPCVSQQHCTIERRVGGTLFVRDRKSRNGTRVDGNTVEGAELRAGSYLTIGRTTLVAYSAPGDHATAIEMLRGHDPRLRETIENALKTAQLECNVLVVGETGTGKELLARCVHEGSRRSGNKLVSVNCGGIPRDLIASELFGHDKGSFTGAVADREGYFVEASGGTLFLDELGELPLELQPHLLRVLESHKVRRVGGSHERSVDVRVVAATNRIDNLGTDASRIRLDLYHRVATVVLSLPPLRERMGDLVELVDAHLESLAFEHGRRIVTEDGWRALASYSWPGNVRELLRTVERAVALGDFELGSDDFFPNPGFNTPAPRVVANAAPLQPYEVVLRAAMEQALQTFGTIRAAAEHLGMAKSTFAEKAKLWGLLPRPRNTSLANAIKKKPGR